MSIAVLFTSKDFVAVVFMVGEKAKFYQTHNQAKEVKEEIHLNFFLCTQITVFGSSCGSGSQSNSYLQLGQCPIIHCILNNIALYSV